MLKFESWPPEAGKMQWTTGALNEIDTRAQYTEPAGLEPGLYAKISSLGHNVGALIAANTTENSLQSVHEMAMSLSDGWSRETAGAFADQAVAGASVILNAEGGN